MTAKKKRGWKRIAQALGASRVVQLDEKALGGPLDWLGLIQVAKSRLVSRGGRPSDPHWEIKRLVPFQAKTWKLLAREANELREAGRKVGPAQLAAIIIENCVAENSGRSRLQNS